jgi:pimeloyl-ACP methyl ester carboxylesterase
VTRGKDGRDMNRIGIRVNPRIYGRGPYSIALLHGGPGAAGEMAPVAREVSSVAGVLEPLQTADTLDGQVRELRDILLGWAKLPLVLAGFSWGAMLAFVYSARFPADVRKLVLISSGVFDEAYASAILPARLSRMSPGERAELGALTELLADPEGDGKDAALTRLGELITRVDAYHLGVPDDAQVDVDHHIHESVWGEAAELRRSGRLLALGQAIPCPVIAIHGDHDPHPADGVRIPLLRAVRDFRFILLEKCGHRPWLELEAREAFFAVLKKELS